MLLLNSWCYAEKQTEGISSFSPQCVTLQFYQDREVTTGQVEKGSLNDRLSHISLGPMAVANIFLFCLLRQLLALVDMFQMDIKFLLSRLPTLFPFDHPLSLFSFPLKLHGGKRGSDPLIPPFHSRWLCILQFFQRWTPTRKTHVPHHYQKLSKAE